MSSRLTRFDWFALTVLLVILIVFFLDDSPFLYAAQFESWSYSLDGSTWKDYGNPLRIYYGPEILQVKGTYHSPSDFKKTFIEFGLFDCVSSVNVNGLDIALPCVNQSRSLMDVTETTRKGLNVVGFVIQNPDKGTLVFEYNAALKEAYYYSLGLVLVMTAIFFYSLSLPKDLKKVVLVISSVTIGFLLLLLRHNIPIGTPGDWTYNRPVPLPSVMDIYLPIIVFLFFFFIIRRGRLLRVSSVRVPLVLCIFSFGLMLTVTNIEYPAFDFMKSAVQSNSATSFLIDAIEINDYSKILLEYHKLQNSFETHTKVHPPGYLLVFMSIIKISPFVSETFSVDSKQFVLYSSVLFYLVFGVLSVVPVYYFTKRVYDDEIAGHTALLFVLSTSFINFTPSHDQINIFLSFTFLYYAWGGFVKRYKSEMIKASLVFGVVLFFSYTQAVLLVFIVIWTLRVTHKKDLRRLILLSVVFLSVFTIFYISLFLMFGFDPIKTFTSIFSFLRQDLTHVRTYWKNVFLQPMFFLVYAGIPTAILFIKRVAVNRSKISRKETTIPFIILFLLLAVSGLMEGETPRILMFLIPFVCMTAALELKDSDSLKLVFIVALLLFIQIVFFKITTSSLYNPYYIGV